LLLATLGAGVIGWPLFLWLDPLSIFTASLNAACWPLDVVALISLGVMATIVVLSLIFPKFWCLKLCPLGGAQDLLFGVKLLATRKKDDIPSSLSRVALARRSAIFTGLGLAGGFVISRSDRSRNQPQLRPPGAVDDTKFKGLCARCRNCVEACPTGIIRQDLRPWDPAGLLTPIVHFKECVEAAEDLEDYCREDCHACTQACPTGAIASLSLEDKLCRPIGLAEIIDKSACPVMQGQQCSICVFEVCPQDAINTNDINMFEMEIVIDPKKCNGCGACVLICPEKIIEVIPNGRQTIAPVDTDWRTT